MEINGKTQKELVQIFRDSVKDGKYASRPTLLAYAYLRNVPYVVLERTINEDKFEEKGKFNFLNYLSYYVSNEIVKASIRDSGEVVGQFMPTNYPLKDDIYQWMREKYNSDILDVLTDEPEKVAV